MNLHLPRRPLTLGAATLLASAIGAAPSGATGSYPGETLSLAQSGPATVGQAANITASGQQTDVNSYAGGFNLEVFQKDPARDSTCSPSYIGEKNTYATELPYEKYIVVGEWQGADTSFNLSFKANFDKSGPSLLCAYSSWITDTAATAQLTVNVAGGGRGGGGGGGGSPATRKPGNVKKPHVRRSGHHLTCSVGTWSGHPTRYAFHWLLRGRALHGATSRRLALTRRLRGHSVRCSVAASNRAGRTTATSGPFRVR
jgi:hypothetical protein